MYLKKTSSFNEKSSGRKKKQITQTERPEEFNYSCDSKGELTIWIKKTEDYAPVTKVNKWHLLKLQMHLQETGKFPRVYQAIYTEIQRRISTGEITTSDTTPKDVAA